jgi:Putative ATP-dependent DNA helicase recG C-terminal
MGQETEQTQTLSSLCLWCRVRRTSNYPSVCNFSSSDDETAIKHCVQSTASATTGQGPLQDSTNGGERTSGCGTASFSTDGIRGRRRITPVTIASPAILPARLPTRLPRAVPGPEQISVPSAAPACIPATVPAARPALSALRLPEHPSRPRNRLLADTFHLAGLIERWGTGTTRMLQLMAGAGLGGPTFAEVAGGFQVTFELTPVPEPPRWS